MFDWVKRLAGIVRYKPVRSEIERRRALRVKAPMHMEVCFLEGSSGDPGNGRVQDISTAGILLASDAKPTAGSPVVLMLHFPKSFRLERPLRLMAKVVQSSKIRGQPFYRVACAFAGLEGEQLKLLQDFVGWLAAES